MTNFLASWELGLRYGHVAPLACLAAALAEQGHAVTLAARDVVTAHQAPGRPFAAILQAPLYLRKAQRRPTLTYAQVVADGGLEDAEAAQALVRTWLTTFDREHTDALVAEHAPMSLIAAHVAGLPAVRVGPGFTTPAATRPFRGLSPWRDASMAERARADAVADTVVATVTGRFGRRVGSLAELLERTPTFLTTWPELDHGGPRTVAAYYGPLAGLEAAGAPHWPDGSGPRAFVYLPFAHPAAAAVAEALAALEWPAIWHSQDRPAAELPANVRFEAEPVDIGTALEQAAVFVGRAGHGSSAAALRRGVASLLLPDTLESQLLAIGLTHAALGVMPMKPTAEAVQRGLRQLVDDAVIAGACAAAKARYGGYDAGAAARQLARDIVEATTTGPATTARLS